MSWVTGSNASPRVSTAPEAIPQYMNASSGSALKPTWMTMRAGP